MPRGLFAGMTDYSHQGFDDVLSDLSTWIVGLTDTKAFIETSVKQLEDNAYWDTGPIEMKALVSYTLKYYATSINEITEILQELPTEVQHNHVTRLNRLGETAQRLNLEFGRIWHREYNPKEYGNPSFAIVERIYSRGRDMVVDMLDIANIAARLEDYVGKRSNLPHQADTPTKQTPGINISVTNGDVNIGGDVVGKDKTEIG